MNLDRFARVKELFVLALPLGPAERDELLARECGDDGAMRDEVVDLLSHAAAAHEKFLDSARYAGAPARSHPQFVVPGYTILDRIATGSAGVVYRARQLGTERLVALKVLRIDALAAGQVARFRREPEIMAALDHPGIARVHGAGVVDIDGLSLPWIAMEFVRGEPLDEYVRRRRPDRNALLALFRDLCDAVDHAHGRRVVHRDLKPSNVLVESNGRPRVLDFGVARMRRLDGAAGTNGTNGTNGTMAGTLVGTLATMAPEQAHGDGASVDARADVYALGVMLYESFAGRPPLDLEGLGLIEAVKVVTTTEPTRLSSVRPDLPADLDAIVGKTLEKDRERRYSRAGELSADISNLLADRPVRARAPTAVDQARKFVRRNRTLTLATAIVVFALTSALATALVALRNRDRQREVAGEAIKYMADRLIAIAPQLASSAERRADMDNVLARVEAQLAAAPRSREMRDTRARLLYEIASIDQAQDALEPMLERLTAAFDDRERLAREDTTDLENLSRLSSICAKIGEARRDLGDDSGRDVWFAKALAIDELLVRRTNGAPEYVEDLGWSLARLAFVANEEGRHDEAQRLGTRRLEDARACYERDRSNWTYVFNLADAEAQIASYRMNEGCAEEALPHAENCVRLADELLRIEVDRRDLVARFVDASRSMSSVYIALERLDEARAHAENALQHAEYVLMRDPRRPGHVELLIASGSEYASPKLGIETRARCERSMRTLRRAAGFVARSGEDAHALIEVANAIEAGMPR